MNIHMPSVFKAGGIAAVVNAILGILSAIPIVGGLVALCYCLGGFLIPIGAGVAYGYFAPGKEDMGQAAVGGALSGAAGGIMYGLFSALSTAVVAITTGQDLGSVLATGALSLILTFCGALFFGAILGAIGGVVWILIQGQRA